MLGEELRKARDEAGLSQERLAFEAGVDRTYLSELENNHKSPTLEMLFRICEALKVPASEIVRRMEQSKGKK